MQRLLGIRNVTGAHGPVTLLFSEKPSVNADTSHESRSIHIGFADDGTITDLEIVAIKPDIMIALFKVAERLELDLSPLLESAPSTMFPLAA